MSFGDLDKLLLNGIDLLRHIFDLLLLVFLILTCVFMALDDLGNKDQRSWVRLSRLATPDRIHDVAYLSCLLLVLRLIFDGQNIIESVGNNGDQQV